MAMNNKSFCRMSRRRKTPARTEWMRRTARLTLSFLAVALVCALNAVASAPEWLRGAAQAPLPKHADDTDAVLLLSEQVTTVTDAGEIRMLYRRAYKIRALAAFVQKDIRYVAIEIGIGGYQPHSAQDIFANRYGDCKD